MKNRARKFIIFLLSTMAFLISGCGKEAFKVTESTTEQKSPGNYFIPPKVDILLVEDNTGSMSEMYSQVSQQMPKLLEDLEAKKWDYHFATIPLVSYRSIKQVLASHYDSNWGSAWTAPYPGAIMGAPGSVSSWAFRMTGPSYTDFITSGDNSFMGAEPGFDNILAILQHEKSPKTLSLSLGSTSGFLRKDALLAVLVLGNGDDDSRVVYEQRNDQREPTYASLETSFDYYRTEFAKIKVNRELFKFYAAVAPTNNDNCLGSRALVGTRYMRMANEFGGQSIDICSQPISAALNGMSQHLQAQKLAMRTRYLFIDQAPNVGTIKVVRYANGDAAQAFDIPQDADNGWTYEGYLENVFAIDSPVPMNQATGFAIELHGSAKLMGNDTADVTFKPAGAQDSVQ